MKRYNQIKKNLRSSLKYAAFFGGATCLSLSAHAADGYSGKAAKVAPAEAAGVQHEAAQVSEKELKSFAKVQNKFKDITTQYESELQGVQDPDKAGEIQQKYQAKLANTIEKSSLSFDRYNQIRNAVAVDPSLQQRYIEASQN